MRISPDNFVLHNIQDGDCCKDWICVDRSVKSELRQWWLTLDMSTGELYATLDRADDRVAPWNEDHVKLPKSMVLVLQEAMRPHGSFDLPVKLTNVAGMTW